MAVSHSVSSSTSINLNLGRSSVRNKCSLVPEETGHSLVRENEDWCHRISPGLIPGTQMKLGVRTKEPCLVLEANEVWLQKIRIMVLCWEHMVWYQ